MSPETIGPYEVTGTLGTGTLGETYTGRRRNVEVALKTLTMAASAFDEVRHRMINEFLLRAQAVGALYHPNIVALRDYGLAGSYLFGASGIILNGSLIDPLWTGSFRPPLAPAVVAQLMKQAAEGLAEAHQQGVVHGNLKPANLFLAEWQGTLPRLQVGDFPLVGMDAQLRLPPGAVRVRRYQAPEQAQEGIVTAESDQYALAVIAYEWLTGQAPFPGGGAKPGKSVTPVANAVPALANLPQVDVVFALALATDRSARYPTIRAFARALSGALANDAAPQAEPVAALPPVDPASTQPQLASADEVTHIPVARQTNPEMPIVPPAQTSRSAWLLAGPEAVAPAGPQPPLTMMPSESFYHLEHHEAPSVAQPLSEPLPSDSAVGVKTQRGSSDERRLMGLHAPHAETNLRGASSNDTGPVGERIGRRDFLGRAVVLSVAGAAMAAGLGVIVTHRDALVSALPGRHGATIAAGIHVDTPIMLSGHTGALRCLAWSPDSTRLASGGAGEGLVRLWDLTSPTAPVGLLTSPDMANGINDCSWARDSHYVLVSPDGADAQVWNVAASQVIAHVPYAANVARWHPREDIAAIVSSSSEAPEAGGGANVILWNISGGVLIGPLKGHTGLVLDVDWSAGAADLLLASGGKDETVLRWEGQTAATVAQTGAPLMADTGPVQAVAWSTTNSQLLAGSEDNMVHLWSDQGKLVTSWRDGGSVTRVAWAPGNAIVAIARADGSISLWDAPMARAIMQLPEAPTSAVNALSWSADGKWLAAGSDDKLIRVWRTTPISG